MTKDDDGLERLQQLMTADKKSMYFECPKYLVNGLIKQLAARDERILELEQRAESQNLYIQSIELATTEIQRKRDVLEQQLKAAQERLAEAEIPLVLYAADKNWQCRACERSNDVTHRNNCDRDAWDGPGDGPNLAKEYLAKHSPSSAATCVCGHSQQAHSGHTETIRPVNHCGCCGCGQFVHSPSGEKEQE